ncbi:thiamine pyrophosphate-dependent enzyme [Sphingopyxis sp. GC21]|uniref:thiamine pyrophosphate-dependent enzyme n=1 Tax=Sphingopyxis sp. GC21 TaxID=2933562 RepID=UPI0021E366E8|nr:thiamine pyrophosphate-dependent enzyme [Sphingopyxis sp. GC21]
MDAAQAVHEKFLGALASGTLARRADAPDPARAGLTRSDATDIFLSQLTSRQMDRLSRTLQARGEGFYTIGSSGHEGNAAVAAALRVTDMAFLHYRSNAFQLHRARQLPGQTPDWDMLLSFAASAEDPISGGRHKVIGSKPLAIPPQTSTIASHLPKAVGAAFSIGIARRLGMCGLPLPEDAVVLASFGDASANHSTAQGAFNTAGWSAFQGTPLPLIFLCEDNGIGISTRTPTGWIEAQFRHRAGLHYIQCDGTDLVAAYAGAKEAADFARRTRKPVFLHMGTVRLYGHAGSDVQGAYLPKALIEADEARDPLLAGAALMVEQGWMSAAEVADAYEEISATLARQAEAAIRRPKLTTAAAVMESLVPPKIDRPPANRPSTDERAALFAGDANQMDKPMHMARLLSWALADLMLAYPEIVVAGEDVGPKGGVYNVTAKLHQRFGSARVINTLLDEQAILGLAIGMAHNGFVPMPEIQFLAYVHNAEDQIRGEAATLSFFSNGQYTNPMVIRIAGLGYQKGFGGHFHNDNSLAVFRDIPGVILAVPSNGRDAVQMLRECVRLAREEQRVVVFVEPIALYMTRDLHEEGDGLWTSAYEAPGEGTPIRLGDVGVHGDGTDLAIVTYGNGTYLSRQAEKLLAADGVKARVIDLRWLGPVDADKLVAAVGEAKRVLIVDECRITGSQSEALMALFTERTPEKKLARIAAEDSFIPLGKAATVTLPSRDSIYAAAKELLA